MKILAGLALAAYLLFSLAIFIAFSWLLIPIMVLLVFLGLIELALLHRIPTIAKVLNLWGAPIDPLVRAAGLEERANEFGKKLSEKIRAAGK